jgi:hypothetical protein
MYMYTCTIIVTVTVRFVYVFYLYDVCCMCVQVILVDIMKVELLITVITEIGSPTVDKYYKHFIQRIHYYPVLYCTFDGNCLDDNTIDGCCLFPYTQDYCHNNINP